MAAARHEHDMVCFLSGFYGFHAKPEKVLSIIFSVLAAVEFFTESSLFNIQQLPESRRIIMTEKSHVHSFEFVWLERKMCIRDRSVSVPLSASLPVRLSDRCLRPVPSIPKDSRRDVYKRQEMIKPYLEEDIKFYMEKFGDGYLGEVYINRMDSY